MYENIKLFAESGRPLEVRFVGETVCDGKYRISRSCSDLNSLEYIVDGAGTLEINGQVLYPKAGDVFLLTEGSRHTYYADQNHPWHKYFISFSGPVADCLLRTYLPRDTYLFHGCYVEKAFARLFSLGLNNQDQDKAQIAMAPVLFSLVQSIYDRQITAEYDLADRIKREIEDRATMHLDLEELCRTLNYSKNHIINRFSAKFGVTPYQYYKNCRLQIAKDYLINTQMTVSEIADALSYTDAQYFSYAFKQGTGCSPSRFRALTEM